MSEENEKQREDKPKKLVFTDAAALKVKTLMDEEENPNLNLRVYITGGRLLGFPIWI